MKFRVFSFLGLALAFSCMSMEKAESVSTASIVQQSKTGNAIQWLSLSEAEQRVKENPKLIFVEFYTNWCGWCKRMDADTFSNPEIGAYLSEHFYPVKFNGEHKKTVSLLGKKYKFVATKKRGYHEIVTALTGGRWGYPTVVITDQNFKRQLVVPGYQSPQELDALLRFFAEDHRETMDFKTFKAKFRSEIQ